MDAKTLFDTEKYFSEICSSNLLACELGFKFCTCSGIESLQGPLRQFRDTNSFFCLDDTNDGALFQGKNAGWFMKRTLTVFIMRKYGIKDERQRMEALEICRRIFRQVCSKLIVDADNLNNDLVYLHTENIMSRELGRYFLSGCTGLYFMIEVSEPVDLKFDAEEWTN